jgi:hypothetical protein
MPPLPVNRSCTKSARWTAAAVLILGIAATTAQASSAVYRWVDAAGITHLSSEKPPTGVTYERVVLATTNKVASPGRSTSYVTTTAPGGKRVTTASAEQVARRNDIVSTLQTRECVIALESIDRMARGGKAVEPSEFRRLQQTADQNCSRNPDERSQQEDMAAQLRVAKGDICVDARNKLADMLEPGRRPTRDQVKTQQEFIESHCTAPVR